MKTKPITCWAVIFDNTETPWLPKLFTSRKSARDFSKSSYPHGRVIQAVIKEIKRK